MSMEKKKTILVLMSTFNGEKYLKEQIDSILNQKTEHEVHLWIRDDGSQDHTCEIVKEYISKFSEAIEFSKGSNLGYNASFFQLINAAGGYDYYSISDQDDIWLDDKLQIACDTIDMQKNSGPILYASTSYLVHNELKPYGTTRKKQRPLSMYNTIIQNICPGHTQVMNNAMINLLKNDVDTSRIYVYDSWITNMANLYGTIVFDNTAHTFYRQYEGNQLGSGRGKLGQLLASLKRVKKGDGLNYRKQIEYFIEMNKDMLVEKGYYEEIARFISAETFWEKAKYLCTTKLYRQSRIESYALYGAIIAGGY